jgi:hypothetical protein
MRGGPVRRRLRPWRWTLLVVAIGLALPATAPYPRLPEPLELPAATPIRALGPPQRPPRVLIAGDSLADQHGSHAAVALREVGIDVHVASWWGWGLFTRQQYDMGSTVVDQPPNTMMNEVVRAVDEFDPDVIALYSNHNYWPPYPRDVSGNTIRMGTPAFTEMVQTQLTELIRRITRNGATVFLIKPAPQDGESADDNPIWNAYAALQQRLGFGIINAGDVVADPRSHGWIGVLADCAGRPAAVRPDDTLHLTYLGAGLMGTVTARALANALGISLRGSSAPSDAPAAMLPAGDGYRLVSCDGATFGFGTFADTLGGAALGGGRMDGDPVVAATVTGAGSTATSGAWLVTAAGRVIGLGGAGDFGAAAGAAPPHRAVGIASTGTGHGYWIALDDGRVEGFGDAPDLGGLASARASADADPDTIAEQFVAIAATPDLEADSAAAGAGLASDEHVVGMTGTPDHAGYWLLTDAGRVAAFGTARSFGDLRRAASASVRPVAIAAHPGGEGYWVLDRAGDVHPFGVAAQHGSAAHQDMLEVTAWNYPNGFQTRVVRAADAPAAAVALLPTPSGNGYWIWLDNGAVCHFGDATILGGLHRAHINFSMRLLGVPFYGPGDCSQSTDGVQAELGQLGEVSSQDLPLRPTDESAAATLGLPAPPG